MSISVVIPTLNEEKRIVKCLKGIGGKHQKTGRDYSGGWWV